MYFNISTFCAVFKDNGGVKDSVLFLSEKYLEMHYKKGIPSGVRAACYLCNVPFIPQLKVSFWRCIDEYKNDNMCDDRLPFLSDENGADGMIRCIHKSVWKKKICDSIFSSTQMYILQISDC